MNLHNHIDKMDTPIEKFSQNVLIFLYDAVNIGSMILVALLSVLIITYGVGIYSTNNDILQLSFYLFFWELGSLVVFLTFVAVCGQTDSCGYKHTSRLIFIISIFFWVILAFVMPGILHHYMGYNL